MIPISVDLVILAIQAGVKLYAGLREAYAASIKERAITLPLPRVPGALEPTLETCADFFHNQDPPEDPIRREEFQKHKVEVHPIVVVVDSNVTPPPDQAFALRAFYARWIAILDPPESFGPNDPGTGEAIFAALSIRQWAKGESGAPVPWQIAVGTVIEVAVLWFANDPGAISTSRPEGKALKAFLSAMLTVDFSHARKTKIVSDTMVAVLNTVAANPGVIANGEREAVLIKATTTSLADAINKIPPATLDSLNSGDMDKLSFIAQSLLAATLRAGTVTVLENPQLFFVDKPAEQAKLLEQVGKVFVGLILPVEVGGQAKIDVAGAVSAKGFETLVRGVLAAVGNNPAIFHLEGNTEKRLTPLLASLATAFSQAALPVSVEAALAETAAIVVTATARNMDTLWPNQSLDPAKNLARGAVVAALGAIAEVPVGGGGLAAFTTEDVVQLADAVIVSVAKNPKLMDAMPGTDPYLKLAVAAMLKALSMQSVRMLSAEDAVVIVAAGVEAATMKQPLLKEAKSGSIVLKAVLEAVFGALAKVKANGSEPAKWRVTGTTLVVSLIEAAFDAVAAVPDANPVTGPVLNAVEDALVKAISEGRPLDELGDAIARTLASQLQLT